MCFWGENVDEIEKQGRVIASIYRKLFILSITLMLVGEALAVSELSMELSGQLLKVGFLVMVVAPGLKSIYLIFSTKTKPTALKYGSVVLLAIFLGLVLFKGLAT